MHLYAIGLPVGLFTYYIENGTLYFTGTSEGAKDGEWKIIDYGGTIELNDVTLYQRKNRENPLF